MACGKTCAIREPVFTEQVLSFKRKDDDNDRWFDVPLEPQPEETDRRFKTALREAATTERDEKWKSSVVEACEDSECKCERTDKIIAGPTNPPKPREVSGEFSYNHRPHLFKLRLKRAWQTVEGLCVDDDEEYAPEDVSFEIDKPSKI